jgi:hypothetical protein
MSREEIIQMLMYFAQQNPEMLHKYANDDDGGEEAFAYMVDNYIQNNG